MSTRKTKGRQGEGKARPENSFIIDKETYLTMVGLIEKAEKVRFCTCVVVFLDSDFYL